MEIRPIRHQEIDALIRELWLPFAREMADLDPFDDLVDEPLETAREYREAHFEDPNVETFVVDAEGGLAGYAVVDHQESPPPFDRGSSARVEEVYVAPAFRGEGLGGTLFDRIESWALERGCEHVSLEVNARNESAIDLYDHRGFTVRRHRMDKPLD